MFFKLYKDLREKIRFCIFFDLLKKFRIAPKKLKIEHKNWVSLFQY